MRITAQPWWRRGDHYYWLTALLAARGAQAPTCRLISAACIGFGLLLVAMTASPSGPQGAGKVAIAWAIGIVCLTLGLLWLRRSWPTKGRSGGFVVIASVSVALACLIQSDALVGLLGCTTFAALAGYVAFFHSIRFMFFNAAVALSTSTALAVREGVHDAVLATCAALLFAVVFVLVPLTCLAIVQLLEVDVPTYDIDPLTGLFDRAAFIRRTGEVVSVRARVDDRYLVIVLLSLDNFSLLTGTGGQVAADRALVSIAQTLRENTRGDAIVAHGDRGQYLISDTFSSTDATPLVERVRGAIATTPPRLTASLGVVVTPLRALTDLPPQEVVEKLIALAHFEMAEARRAGGNQASYIECAAPKLDDDRIDDEEPW